MLAELGGKPDFIIGNYRWAVRPVTPYFSPRLAGLFQTSYITHDMVHSISIRGNYRCGVVPLLLDLMTGGHTYLLLLSGTWTRAWVMS